MSYLEDMGTSASVIISTFMGGIYAVVIGSGYGLVASGWVPWEKLVGSGLLFVCALFAATGAYRLGARRLALWVLLGTCAPWALFHAVTPLDPIRALALTIACKVFVKALGAACQAP